MKNLTLKTIFFITLLLSSGIISATDLSADRKKLKGTVVDKETNEALIGATIYVEEFKTGTASDIDGHFVLKLPSGKYTLKISYMGYKTATEVIEINSDLDKSFLLEKDTKTIDDVIISAKRSDENVSSTNMSVEKMKIKEIRAIPALMGEVDIIKAIQLLPGVQATSEGGSGFSVRGGNMDQNLILVDDAPVYNASHLMGFFSVFNNDAVDEINLYKGDMPVAYGGRLSSLLDIKIKEGDGQQWHAQGGIGTISSRLTVDGPIGNENTTVLLAGRRSYADVVFLPFAKDENVRNATLYFYDLNAKIKHKIDLQNTILVNGYMGKDDFGQSGFEFGFGNKTGSASWLHTYNENVATKCTFIYSQYGYKTSASFDEAANFVWNSRIRDYGGRVDNTFLINDSNTVKFGFSSIYHRFSPGIVKPGGDNSIYSEYELAENSAIEWGVYGSNTQQVGNKLTLKYGLRYSIFQNVGPGTIYNFAENYSVIDSTTYKSGDVYNVYQGLEPRVGMVYRLNDISSVKASYSRTRQYIHLASNSTGGTPLDIWIASNPNIKPQIADQVAVGYFRNFWANQIETSCELYYKKMNNTIDFKDHAQLFLNRFIDGELRIGESWSYGAEFQVKFNTEKFNGWVSYTLSKTKRLIPAINRGQEYVAPYDKPNDIGIVLNYQLTKRLLVSANWVYATGSPMTIPSGSFIIDNVQLSSYTERNSYRMPDYHRLDLGLTLSGKEKPGKRYHGELNFSVYNAYARHNAWAINFNTDPETGITTAEKTYLFSVIPSLTYNFKF